MQIACLYGQDLIYSEFTATELTAHSDQDFVQPPESEEERKQSWEHPLGTCFFFKTHEIFLLFLSESKTNLSGTCGGGPAVKNPPSKAGDTSSIPGQQTGPTYPGATKPSQQLLSPHTPEPEHRNEEPVHCSEDPAQLNFQKQFFLNNVFWVQVIVGLRTSTSSAPTNLVPFLVHCQNWAEEWLMWVVNSARSRWLWY